MSETSLKKTLGVARGTALMLNIVLGAGLLTLPGLAFRDAGAQAIYVWLACAAASVPLLAVFAIVGQRFPDAGGIPNVAGRTFGPTAYRAATFLFFGAVSLGLPAIALTGGYYASSFLGLSPHLLAFIILALATLVNFLSVELAGKVNGVIASTLIFVLLLIAAAGAYAVFGSPVVATPPVIALDTSKFAALFMMVFFAFTGWEVAAHLSEEFKNPQRDIPRAMGLSFIVALAFYLVLAAIVGASSLNAGFEAPFASILGSRFGPVAGIGIAAVAVLLVFANLSAATWAVSRLVVSAAREGLFPAALANTANGTPVRAVGVVLAVLSSAILFAALGFLPLDRLLEYAGQNFLIIYAFAAAALLKVGPGLFVRVIAALALLFVAAVLVNRDLHAMIYPAALIILAALSRLISAPKAATDPAAAGATRS